MLVIRSKIDALPTALLLRARSLMFSSGLQAINSVLARHSRRPQSCSCRGFFFALPTDKGGRAFSQAGSVSVELIGNSAEFGPIEEGHLGGVQLERKKGRNAGKFIHRYLSLAG
ncbi:hypothetical protein RRG08_060805 [Elysia crispata]|uniref:Uncharacterized protein n=1 Tax=Elysia crispata TaxID=231223 RepID=A0AAE0YW07_9GAST|nr:hypothetical protein RRG08_060805 [Elysia crispata]